MLKHRASTKLKLWFGLLAISWLAIPACAPAAMSPGAQQQASQLYQKHDWSALEALAKRSASGGSTDGMAWYYLGLAEDGLGRKTDAGCTGGRFAALTRTTPGRSGAVGSPTLCP